MGVVGDVLDLCKKKMRKFSRVATAMHSGLSINQ